ncbi:Uncharacterised protein [Mycobacteroides abscessus subsp. bolletii]|uniref:hypothetical protein n=1 Tax=Mycobacteroides abscessus TaxID=36809 RepID=UPI0009A8AC11|nr:hypothetical protein [Mycobacteroides abscessus]SKY97734.1 Uncharacterised protein [Mycobacteroides abscessus subsp. bolletii]
MELNTTTGAKEGLPVDTVSEIETGAAAMEQMDWYIATNSKGVYLGNFHPFARIRRAGERKMSWNLLGGGFRLRTHPTGILHEPYTLACAPWVIWKVRPDEITTREYAARTLGYGRTRRLTVLERMPDGFEFGPHGVGARQLVEHVAVLHPWPQPLNELPSTSESKRYLDAIEELHAAAEPLMTADLIVFKDFANEVLCRRTQRHKEIFKGVSYKDVVEGFSARCDEFDTLLTAAITGTPLPSIVREHWQLPAQRSA